MQMRPYCLWSRRNLRLRAGPASQSVFDVDRAGMPRPLLPRHTVGRPPVPALPEPDGPAWMRLGIQHHKAVLCSADELDPLSTAARGALSPLKHFVRLSQMHRVTLLPSHCRHAAVDKRATVAGEAHDRPAVEGDHVRPGGRRRFRVEPVRVAASTTPRRNTSRCT